MEESLNTLAESIVSLLIFEESFENIVEEITDASVYEVADELKYLIAKDFVKPCRDLENDKRSGILFDSDKLSAYSFALTARGINYLEKLSKSSKKA